MVRSIALGLILISVSSFADSKMRISGSDIIQKFSPESSGLNDREGCELKTEKTGKRSIDCWYVDYDHYDHHKFSIPLVAKDIVVYKDTKGGDCFEMSGPTAESLLKKANSTEMDECYHYDFWKPINDEDERRIALMKAAPSYVSDDPYHP